MGIKAAIFGSCVSKDILVIGGIQKLFECTSPFISFISPYSLMFEKSSHEYTNDNFEWGTEWYKKNLVTDLNRNFLNVLKEANSDFLILDLSVAYYSIIEFNNKFGGKSFGTFAASLNKNFKALKQEDGEYKLHRALEFSDDFLEQGMKVFCDALKTIYRDDQIILVETFFANKYLDKDGSIKEFTSKTTDQLNILMEKLNSLFLKNITPHLVLEHENTYLGDANHKWNLGRQHYIKDFYKERAEILKNKLFP
ncbi:hypothetical protein GIX10_00375 [Acinetobacter sp. YIM 103518]|uniref:Uncharacterized protein n=1 Tax=Acinetobacter faecalis TaxID=2665161 RepID=A0A6L6GBH2_9GAMM|nr:DUF6270 domain-containing protein [Acinetobacter faecalis]MTD09911.1 hypothetical protein [Acinetobacter faecalis]